jgi:predicted DNA-binding transcriptional regulator YafY
LLTFGSDVEVLDPPELRDRIRGAAEEVVALYR